MLAPEIIPSVLKESVTCVVDSANEFLSIMKILSHTASSGYDASIPGPYGQLTFVSYETQEANPNKTRLRNARFGLSKSCSVKDFYQN
jgi:hypothetical protein